MIPFRAIRATRGGETRRGDANARIVMGVGVNAAEFEHWVTERDKKALEKVGGVERVAEAVGSDLKKGCLLYTSPSPRDS